MSDTEEDSKPPPRSRDEVKEEAAIKRQQNQQMANFDTILDTVQNSPTLYNYETFGRLRRFVQYVHDHPDAFTPPLPSKKAEQHKDWVEKHPLPLTKNLGHALYDYHEVKTDQDIEDKPIVLVLNASKKPRSVTKDSVTYVSHYWSLVAVDADKRAVLLKVNSCLNDHAALFSTGCVIRLLQFAPIFLEQGERTIAALFFTSFDYLGLAKTIPNMTPPPNAFDVVVK